MNPQDLELLRASGVPVDRADQGLRWVADPGVDGGCLVESEAGVADATVGTQLRVFRERLEEVSGG